MMRELMNIVIKSNESLMIFIIIILLLALFSAWEEIQQLVQRRSWSKENFYSFLFWDTAWDGKWKLFDSHHVAFGLFVVVMVLGFYFINLKALWQLPVIWALFFYLRNIFMHIVLNKNKDYGYLYRKF